MHRLIECGFGSKKPWSYQSRVLTSVLVSLCCAAMLRGGDVSQAPKHVTIGALPPGWQLALLTYGDRMQKPGKERLTISGTVTRGGSATAQFQVIHELPNSIRYQEQGGSGATTVVFDGNQYGKSSGNPQKQDSDLVETLVYDSPTGFMYAPVSGVSIRKLGSRFRTVGIKDDPFAGSAHDVYVILTSIRQAGKIKQQPKFYHVNSDTFLLDRVNYQDTDNPGTRVEIILNDWAVVAGNRIPQLIRRLENGVEVLRFNITSAVFGPSVADGSFQKP